MRFVASILWLNLELKACQPPHASINLHFQFFNEIFKISVTLIIIIKMLLDFVFHFFFNFEFLNSDWAKSRKLETQTVYHYLFCMKEKSDIGFNFNNNIEKGSPFKFNLLMSVPYFFLSPPGLYNQSSFNESK